MAWDRDIAVAFATAYFPAGGPPRVGWEVTAATGVRGLRLLTESGRFGAFTLTESHPEAFQVLSGNAGHRPGAIARLDDGRLPPAASTFDYVDIDPYGTPVPFVPAALTALRPGGVLAVSATDMMVLAGVQRGATERRYGARPIRGRLGPEAGLRILLAYLVRSAGERGLTLRPLLAYVGDHQVRAYLQSHATPPNLSELPIGSIDPASWTGPPVGEQGPYGPLWLGPLLDRELVRSLTVPAYAACPHEVAAFLERLRGEVDADRPFFYEPNVLARSLKLPHPPPLAAILEKLRAEGFPSSRTHVRPEGFRTTAPRSRVEEVVRSWSAAQSQNARVRA